MPLVNRPFVQLSDLVLTEKRPATGEAREVVFVDVASDTTVTLGTVAYRAKAATDTAYALLTAAAQLVATNEFIVLFGDEYGCKDSWVLLAADTTDNAVGFVRDNVILKDYLLKQLYTTGGSPVLTAPQFEALRHLLKSQGVILEITVQNIQGNLFLKYEDIIQYKAEPSNHFNSVNKISEKYGKLEIIFYAGKNKDNKTQWAARCECGEYLLVITSKLAPTNMKTSCGCSPKRKSVKPEDIERRKQQIEKVSPYTVVDVGDGRHSGHWIFNCKEHGNFKARWSHIAKDLQKCSGCNIKGGFDSTLAGKFYLNEVNDMQGNFVAIKYGVTNNPVEKRLKQIEAQSKYYLTNITYIDFEIGVDALVLERLFSKKFGKKYLNKKDMPRGYTETIPPKFKDECLNFISNYKI